MPQFNLYYFNDNFSEYIQDNNLYIEESEAVLCLGKNLIQYPSVPQNDESFGKYEHLVRGLVLSSPWSKGGVRHLVPRILSDLDSKNRKE